MPELQSLAIDTSHKRKAQVRVVLADLDTGSGFLPDLIIQANKAQRYFDFDMIYLPFPSGSVVRRKFKEFPVVPRLFLPNLDEFLAEAPTQLGVDVVCCLTGNLVATDDNRADLFTSPLPANRHVRFVSTYGVREYAKQAEISFARATLSLCLAELLLQDERWNLEEHDETAGCLLDYCDERSDLVVSLRHAAFDHDVCRNKIQDRRLLEAVDRLLALELDKGLADAEA